MPSTQPASAGFYVLNKAKIYRQNLIRWPLSFAVWLQPTGRYNATKLLGFSPGIRREYQGLKSLQAMIKSCEPSANPESFRETAKDN
jgi:hypothetical protein